MSDCWTEDQYDDVLAFVERGLWQFVQANAAVHNPRQVIASLTQLNAMELRFLLRLHFLLAFPVQHCVNRAIPALMDRLVPATERVISENRGGVRGHVDWNLTLKHRLRSGRNDPGLYVTHSPSKTYNLPELQALKYLLMQINGLCLEALGDVSDSPKTLHSGEIKWKHQIAVMYHQTTALLKNIYLRGLTPPERITDAMLQRVRTARNPHFKAVYESLQLYRRLLIVEDKEALKTCISQMVLRPLNRDTLYELHVLFGVLNSLGHNGWQADQLHLIGFGSGAIATYHKGVNNARVYYQTLARPFAANSAYTALFRNYDLDVRLRRPDLLIELNTGSPGYTLVEVKRTQDKEYIVDSVYKVFGYLKDFEQIFANVPVPQALLVVWDGIDGKNDPADALVILHHRNYQQYLDSFLI